MSRRLIVVAASLVITLIAGVAIASSHASGPPDDPGVPRFLDGEDLPPGLEGKVPLPPGLEMKAGSWTPPGQAGGSLPPGHDAAFVPPGQIANPGGATPPGQDPSFVPPGQVGKAGWAPPGLENKV